MEGRTKVGLLGALAALAETAKEHVVDDGSTVTAAELRRSVQYVQEGEEEKMKTHRAVLDVQDRSELKWVDVRGGELREVNGVLDNLPHRRRALAGEEGVHGLVGPRHVEEGEGVEVLGDCESTVVSA
jgi:hypothetical protein